ncbi:MAG: hypothetical protein RLP44_17320 [Aggregatilineales bacterium]
MHLNCPNCGEQISADNVNIQKMVAVCAVCDTVFQFDTPHAKIKRRKVKQPKHLMLNESDTLHVAFRTNFRLDKDESFLFGAIMSFVFTFITLILTSQFLVGEMIVLVPLGFMLLTLSLYYWLASIVFNKTDIVMDEDAITVSRQPLPIPFTQPLEITLADVVAVRCGETPTSKKEAYDTPRYRVWAQTADGRQRVIVNDVTEEYAYFLAQRMTDHLDADAYRSTSHLMDDDVQASDFTDNAHDFQQMSQNQAKR